MLKFCESILESLIPLCQTIFNSFSLTLNEWLGVTGSFGDYTLGSLIFGGGILLIISAWLFAIIIPT